MMHQREFARMLLENGAVTTIPLWSTPLQWASEYGHIEAVRLLLEHGADPLARDYEGMTPSELASRNGHVEIVRLLSQKSVGTVSSC